CLGDRRRSDQVNEQDRDEAPLGAARGRADRRSRRDDGRAAAVDRVAALSGRGGLERTSALAAEPLTGQVRGTARGAGEREPGTALRTELPIGTVLRPACGTTHPRPPFCVERVEHHAFTWPRPAG